MLQQSFALAPEQGIEKGLSQRPLYSIEKLYFVVIIIYFIILIITIIVTLLLSPYCCEGEQLVAPSAVCNP